MIPLRRLFLVPALLLAAGAARADVAVVLNSGEDTLSVVGLEDYAEKARIPIGREPHHLMLTPDQSELIIANAVSNDLVFLEPRTGEVKRRLRNISDPYQLGFTPDRKRFVAASLRLDRVDIYAWDGHQEYKLEARIPIASMPSHLAFAPDNRHVYVTLQGSDKVAAIDIVEKTIVWESAVGLQPAGILLTPQGTVVAGVMGRDYIAELDAKDGKLLRKVVTGKGAHNVFAGPDGRMYVTNRLANTITALDMATLEIKQTYKGAGGPDCIDFTSDKREMWVTARWLKSVHVFDVASGELKRTIPVGRSPHGIFVWKKPIAIGAAQ